MECGSDVLVWDVFLLSILIHNGQVLRFPQNAASRAQSAGFADCTENAQKNAGILHGGLDGSRKSVKGQVRQEACVPSGNNQLHDYYRRSRNF